MKSQSWPTAPLPASKATAMERAGLTEVLVTGMETRWIIVRVRPMASGAKPAFARESVEPMMTMRKMKVMTTSHRKAAPRP